MTNGNLNPCKQVYENFQELNPEKRDLIGYHSKPQEEKNKISGPIFLTKKYEIKEKDRNEWDKEKEKEKTLSEKLGKEEVSRLTSLGEQGVKILLDKLIDVTPKYNPEHKNWNYIGDILDYVNNKKYDWLIDYQKKASKKCYSRIKILGIDFTNLYNKLRIN